MSERVVSSNCWTHWYFQTPQMLLWHKNIMKYKTVLYCQTNIVLSCQQPAPLIGVSLDFFFPQHEFKSCALLPYFNYSLHKWSSCIKSDLGWVQGICTTAFPSANQLPLAALFMLQNYPWTSRTESFFSSTSSCNRCVLSTWNYAAEPISPLTITICSCTEADWDDKSASPKL